MFRFEHPYYLYALEILPLLGVFFYLMLQARKRAMQRFGNSALVKKLAPQVSRYKHAVKFWLFLLGITFLIFGAANPQWGVKREQVKRKGIDVFIALDVSKSMLAEDLAPNRLERAKKFSEDLVEKLRGERIGLMIFAGNAYLQVPLTVDYAALDLFIKTAGPDLVPTQGTAISEVFALSERSFPPDNRRHKALIIISDGETHDDDAQKKAEEAAKNGLLVFTVGIGTAEGAFIPEFVNGRMDFVRDERGNPARTRLEEESLRRIAAVGNGAYFNLANNTDQVLRALQQRVENIEKREFEQQAFSEYESYFQYFLAIALLLLVIEFLISYTKNRYLADKDLFRI
ncbi:MAG TPA: VWA domain-containing protein [Saprospiraceae bacterium]|nr:VWA domain-containing protein [Saprospiraceae bacterium]HMP24576.1 VWA domain-containing protein [Saprospiraceae bacterium]